jgi:hypothetical protein
MTEDILRKVRGLIAKANSTDHEGERRVFMAKADELMEKYAIDQAMLRMGENKNARVVVRRDMDISWWSELSDIDFEARSNIWWLFKRCVDFCRCYTAERAMNFRQGNCPVYGMDSDLSYLDMLFTDLLLQMVDHIKPKYDPSLSMGQNVMRAKEAGMKYIDIAVWLGHPEWRVPNGTGGYKTADNGKMLREYKQYLRTLGKLPSDVVSIHPTTWQVSYVEGFCVMVRTRLNDMIKLRAGGTGDDNSMALVVRDIRDQAMEAFNEAFPPPVPPPPHPDDCKCVACKAKRKPVKYRPSRQYSDKAYLSGADKGRDARIVTNDPKLRTPGRLGE